ncbi:hypothetical protein BFW88_12835 [Pseudomonas fluorescens]|nr:hypothetical protein BFW88_12835 [Pseudomonas fluorescens]OPB10386.1 hypothetical protein BFW92_13030 [Pseudomonas fluorescens]OPB21638.1 hypothetical protein BFW93_12820 [Pseudomonas fluorescens]
MIQLFSLLPIIPRSSIRDCTLKIHGRHGACLVQQVSQWHGGQVHALDSELGGASFRMTWAYAGPL